MDVDDQPMRGLIVGGAICLVRISTVTKAGDGFVIPLVLVVPVVCVSVAEEMEVQRSTVVMNENHLGPGR